MKRFLILLLIITLLLLCSGCGKRDLGLSSSQSPKEQSSTARQPQQSSSPSQTQTSQQSDAASAAKTPADKYADILRSGTYYIDGKAVISVEGMKLENPMLIAVKDGNSSISVSSDLSGAMVTMRTLAFGGQIYSINDAQRTYMQIDPEQAANSFDVDYFELMYIGDGTADFGEELLPYTEYRQGEDIVRLFFRGNALVGLTRTIKDEQLSELVLKISGLSGNIPDRLIEMPIGYTKQ